MEKLEMQLITRMHKVMVIICEVGAITIYMHSTVPVRLPSSLKDKNLSTERENGTDRIGCMPGERLRQTSYYRGDTQLP